MSTISPLSSGLAGIRRAVDGLARDADRIARAGTQPDTAPRPTDVVEPLVHLTEDRFQAAASARVIETENDVLGTLLDVKA